ncbi:MAG: tRNA preQ1(34) S-adenosylmethionine ribosyltransferase-isomerase QueA [Lachnospiraceae bacterium]|nr:tRNA preQ1(34) S-adenosylmethionine ribosyltransferase-isomerase QueA [Lachnospiraceae bacterium]
MLKTSDFIYELPPELIAQDPLPDRSASRLLVMGRESGALEHKHFTDLPSYLRKGDCLVLNDSRVIPARLYGVREDTGGAVEVLLLKRLEDSCWECLVRPGKKARPGMRLSFGDGLLHAEVLDMMEEGNRRIRFSCEGIFEEILDRLGEMPLPPYITHKLPREQRERYQTVYSRVEGSAAAPTAGLHFTQELLQSIRDLGVETVFVTLHVGLGTFRPVKAEVVTDHHMHTEYCEISREAAQRINDCRTAGGRVICVGTTSVRTIESMAEENGVLKAGSRETDIFIYPGYRFRITDGLITNFHLPGSTLLMLVSAFAGREHVLAAYEEAVKEHYRFFSFGDAMLLI